MASWKSSLKPKESIFWGILTTKYLKRCMCRLPRWWMLESFANRSALFMTQSYCNSYLHTKRTAWKHLLLDTWISAGKVLEFILTRKYYYITDLQIDQEHFSSWDVHPPTPTARVPPTVGPDPLHSNRVADTAMATGGYFLCHRSLKPSIQRTLGSSEKGRTFLEGFVAVAHSCGLSTIKAGVFEYIVHKI